MGNHCNGLAADFLLFGRRCDGGGGAGLNGITKVWAITEENADQCVFPISHPFLSRFLAVRVFNELTWQEVKAAIFFPEPGMVHVVFADPQPVGSVFRIIVVEIDNAENESA